MKLIFALGNPESRYSGTRHNVGFAVLNSYVEEQGATWQSKDKFKAQIAELSAGGEKVILAKPTTYYNLVGESARALMDFYKLSPQDALIVHDDLALDFGTIRTRIGGSGGGNNGIKSLNAHIGLDTMRLRIGVGNDLRGQIPDADFVMGKFTRNETTELAALQQKVVTLIEEFITGSLVSTTHKKSPPSK